MSELPLEDLSAGPEWLVLRARMEGLVPDYAWRAWTYAERLTQWWPQEADLDVVEGGAYHLAWPRMDWHLRGRYSAIEPGRTLVFSWAWDHEPETAERQVRVDFEPLPGGSGTLLTITHGPYGDGPSEAQDRQGHIEGWTQFLGRLSALGPASD